MRYTNAREMWANAQDGHARLREYKVGTPVGVPDGKPWSTLREGMAWKPEDDAPAKGTGYTDRLAKVMVPLADRRTGPRRVRVKAKPGFRKLRARREMVP